MAEEDTDPPAPAKDAPPDEPKPDDIAAMKAALRKANKEAETARLKLKEIEDRDKTDGEKLTERITAAEAKSLEAEARASRLEVALAKGLTATQAKRLVGTTTEELEADADELLASFKSDAGGAPPPGKPTEQLRGGGDPTEEPAVDMRAVVDAIPRGI